MEFSLPIRIYIEDTDVGGIVYYVNYLKFMERARTEFMRQQGFAKAAMGDDGLIMVVHSANIQYRSPARLDDEVRVTASILRCARSYIVFSQQVFRGDKLLCEAEVKVACVQQDSMKPTALPQQIKDALTPMVEQLRL